jgi:CRP-like cAMP-binding protein
VEGRVEDELKGSVRHSLVQALACVPGFDLLDDPTLLQIAGASSNLLYRAGSTVFQEGDEADALYVILTGEIELGPGLGLPDVRLGTGDFFGETSMLLETPRTRTVRAVEDCELLVLPRETFHRLLSEQPELDLHVRTKLEERLSASAAGTET